MAIVYLSSTRIDLLAEREAVTQWLVKARHEVRHSYIASTEPLVASCIADVRGSDIYLLLAGQRYGDRPKVDNPDQLSITELEFRAAREAGKPIVALFQANPQFDLTDHAGGIAEVIAALKRFHDDVRSAVTPDRFGTPDQLIAAVSTGVTEAVRKLEDKRREFAPPITPGVSRPHPRLLSRSLLLIHAGGADEPLARRLADALAAPGIGWQTARFAWNPEDGSDWVEFDRQLAECRTVALLRTPSALDRFAPAAHTLSKLVDFATGQCGLVVGFDVGTPPRPPGAAVGLALRQRHALDDWAAAPAMTITADLAQAVKQIRDLHPDVDDPRLVGLQFVVLAMTAQEAQELQDQPALLETLGEEQRSFFADATKRLDAAGAPWTARYQPRREDWQPFGPGTEPDRSSVLALLRDAVQQINRQTVVPRRDQDALLGHRIRLRAYPLEPLLADDADWLPLYEQMKQRRFLVLVDELSLCHPRLRTAAADLLADPNVAVATIAPFDPPPMPIEAALRGNGVLRLGGLIPRFRNALDPQCELSLASMARLRRWLRVNVPETLATFSAAALDERRARIRSEAGLG